MKKPKIVAFFNVPIEWLTSLLALKMDPSIFELKISRPPYDEDEVCQAVKDANIILTWVGGPFLSRKILEATKDLQFIQFGSVGYAKIDLEAVSELGIPVANNPGWNKGAVAEYTVMSVLVLLKKAFHAHQGLTQGEWINPRTLQVRELAGKTVGILGLGDIGAEVAKRIGAFGCKILYSKRNPLSDAEEKALGVKYRTFEGLLRESDVLTVHVPHTDETRDMIGKDEIAMMKDGAILINTARREIVDEVALAEALKKGKLSGASIDVPRDLEDRKDFEDLFAGFENVVLTPHISGRTEEARLRWQTQAAENIKRFHEGMKLLYLVNEV